ncbi:hypothetical protein HI914_03923 [Erysiphe necator]|nr:hypothetical protein HI914_03923 [Erysiphe necator]
MIKGSFPRPIVSNKRYQRRYDFLTIRHQLYETLIAWEYSLGRLWLGVSIGSRVSCVPKVRHSFYQFGSWIKLILSRSQKAI